MNPNKEYIKAKTPRQFSLLYGCLVIISMSVIFGVALVLPHAASADGIGITPLKYQTKLDGKVKKGMVDIQNDSGLTQKIKIKILAFKQIDNKGSLKFYQDPEISDGITPDYDHFKLKPYETMRLYFLADGNKLPKKQIFAALFAESTPLKPGYNITPVLRVGTLLMLKNGDGDQAKQGQISNLKINFWQIGNKVSGSFDFANTESGPRSNGFFPKYHIKLGRKTKEIRGKLVFPGIKRRQSFSLTGNHLGIYKLVIGTDAKTGAQQWMIVVTGVWLWLFPLIILAVATAIIYFVRRKKTQSNHKKKLRKSARKNKSS